MKTNNASKETWLMVVEAARVVGKFDPRQDVTISVEMGGVLSRVIVQPKEDTPSHQQGTEGEG